MTDQSLSEGASIRDAAAINAALKEQWDSSPVPGEREQPMRLAGSAPIEPDTSQRVSPERLQAKDEPPKLDPSPGLPLPEARPGGAPAWFRLPDGFEFPRGRQIFFLRFMAEWTDTPWKGERQVCMWSVGVGDEKIALMRSMSDPLRAQDELVKQSLRITDGRAVTLEDGSLDVWYDEIGKRCRTLLKQIWNQLHVVKPSELQRFLKDCVEVRSAG